MSQRTRNAAVVAVLAFLCLETAAVQLLLELPLAARLLAHTAALLTAAACLAALLVPRLPRQEGRFSESRCQRRALDHRNDHEWRAREHGRTPGRI
ncbi:hypothetical protein ABT354_00760 [Streptomyces sp. NPDC000594]|uniref:hypothetical protein n=1 Tax=Streptomyces sp. NPDC000594 TaxID=3154261 RepID=UPI00331D1A9C